MAIVNGDGITFDTSALEHGAWFDTAFEQRCQVETAPDAYGNFDAFDSDGVVCAFNVCMVTWIHRY